MVSVRNSERFLYAYNRIEQTLKKMNDNNGSYLPFYRLLDRAKQHNAVIRKFEDDLRAYANLRNAIVHNLTDAEYAIAEPHEEIVNNIEHIDALLAKPITVGEVFRRRVHVMRGTDRLAQGLALIRKQQFNQIPIYGKNGFIGLVTATAIMYWLADKHPNGIVKGKPPTLLDVYHHEKKKKTFQFIPQNLPVYEAEEYFKRAIIRGGRLEALLITENGRPKERLIGIITPRNLLKID